MDSKSSFSIRMLTTDASPKPTSERYIDGLPKSQVGTRLRMWVTDLFQKGTYDRFNRAQEYSRYRDYKDNALLMARTTVNAGNPDADGARGVMREIADFFAVSENNAYQETTLWEKASAIYHHSSDSDISDTAVLDFAETYHHPGNVFGLPVVLITEKF